MLESHQEKGVHPLQDLIGLVYHRQRGPEEVKQLQGKETGQTEVDREELIRDISCNQERRRGQRRQVEQQGVFLLHLPLQVENVGTGVARRSRNDVRPREEQLHTLRRCAL